MSNEKKDKLESIKQSIIKGEVYAHVESVSNSGMSRRILFYRISYNGWSEIDKAYTLPQIENITAEIAWLTGWIKEGEYKQGGKWIREAGFRVGGCGMDMVFHTLDSCLNSEEKKEWGKIGKRYNSL